MTTFGLTIVVSHHDKREKKTNINICEQTDTPQRQRIAENLIYAINIFYIQWKFSIICHEKQGFVWTYEQWA